MTLIATTYKTHRTKVSHLKVKQSVFSESAKLRLQRIGSPARWDPATWTWDCPLTPAAVIALDKAAQDLGETVQWSDDLRDFADLHLKQSQLEHEVRIGIERIIRENIPVDAYVTRTHDDNGQPMPPLRHQQILWHWSQRVRGLLLAWDPGVGKTRGATDAAGGWYRNQIIKPMEPALIGGVAGVRGGVLVVCPKTMLKTWLVEVAKWQNATGVIVAGTSVKKQRMAAQPAHFHITNYESLKYVAHNEYNAVIADECHRCSNNTNQTSHVRDLASKATRVLGLSGTPISNSLESIFYPMLIIDGGKTLGPNRQAFLEKYFRSEHYGNITRNLPLPDSAKLIGERISEYTYFVKKEEVLDLPPKTHTPIYLDMTADQERYYHQVKSEAVAYIQDAAVTVEQAAARMMKLMQICQGFVLADDGAGRHFNDVKSQALTDMLSNELSTRKVVVWAYFQYEIQRLVDSLTAARISHVRIDGTINSQRVRDDMVDRWNLDPNVRVFVRQLSMSEGVTLHAKDSTVPCYDCIYLALSYRLVDWKQSQDRIHRIGQKYACNYTYFLTDQGIDRAVYEKVLMKAETAQLVHDTGKDYYLQLLRGT